MSKIKKYLVNLEKALFFLSILFLPTQLGKHFWPSSSFIYSLRVDYLSPAIYFWDLLVLGLFGVFGILGVIQKRIKLNRLFLSLLLIFLATQMLSLLNAVNPQAGLVRLKDYLIAGLFGLYLCSHKDLDIKKLFFIGFLGGVLFSCLLAILQFLLGHSLGLWILGERDFSVTTPLIAKFNFYEQVFLRPYGTFPHPNLLAAFLVLALPMLNFGLSEKFNKLRLMLTLLISSTVFITFSRPGIMLIAIQSIALFKRFWKLLLILGVIITPLIFVRFSSIFNFDSLAVMRRQQLLEYALKIFLKHPLNGVGLNNFINILASDAVLVGTSRFLQPVHNIFLLTLAETGILGLLGFLGLLGTAIWKNLKKRDKLSKALLGNLLTIIFLGLFDHYFLTLPQGQRLFFLILGLSFIKQESKVSKESEESDV